MTETENTRRQHNQQAPSQPSAPHHEPPIALVLLDLDGTLLRDDKTVSDYTLQVLNRCQQEGILIGFCTSRGKTSIGHLITRVKPDIVATNGGATITLQDTVLHHQGFTVQETQTLLDAAYRIIGPDCEITVDTADQLYWNRGDNKSVMYHPQALEHDFRNFPHPAMKICVQTDHKALAAAIAQTVPHCHALLFSDVPWHSFAPGSATKEAAAQLLSQELDIPLAEIMAFGDDFNDLGMISTVGRGIAMGNAIPEIKAVANDVAATNNEDGVAQYLEKLLQSQGNK